VKGFCPWCGSLLRPGVLFCESCGMQITEQEPAYPPVAPPPTTLQQPKRISPRAAGVAGFLVGALLTLVFLLVIGGNPSTQIVVSGQTVTATQSFTSTQRFTSTQSFTVTTTAVRMSTVVPVGAVEPPYTLIQNGKVVWRFRDLSRRILEWNMEIETYKGYAERPKSTASVKLHSDALDRDFQMSDMRPYIIPSFFSKVIGDLTTGRNSEDFVREVDNIKNQIVVYGSGLSEGYQWPAETLTEGRGRCGDTTILMASMLIAGNNYSDYGMNIEVWYVDSNRIDREDANPNHAIVRVLFADGGSWIIETTTNELKTYPYVWGWHFDVTDITT